MKGFFITFEGLEGAGKSTQARILYKTLREEGFPCILTSEPGGTPLGDVIRDVLADNRFKDMSPLAELFLFSASRAQHVENLIRPSIEEGKIVLCDRYFDATLAYQGFGRGLPENLIRDLNSTASWNVRPDLTFLLEVEPAKGLTRVSKRIQELEIPAHRIEKEKLDFFEKVREGYYYIAKEEPGRFRIVDSEVPLADLSKRIYDLTMKELKKIKFKKNLMKNINLDI